MKYAYCYKRRVWPLRQRYTQRRKQITHRREFYHRKKIKKEYWRKQGISEFNVQTGKLHFHCQLHLRPQVRLRILMLNQRQNLLVLRKFTAFNFPLSERRTPSTEHELRAQLAVKWQLKRGPTGLDATHECAHLHRRQGHIEAHPRRCSRDLRHDDRVRAAINTVGHWLQ